MHKKFDNQALEKKWQEKWQADKLYDAGKRSPDNDKEYVLVEWPYPSGNLHIGHWYAFGVPDIYVRFRRMLGAQVLFPMGFDAFGLPAENAAIKHNLNPRDWTEKNIAYMRSQLESMGNAFSWDKTTSSTDEDYYRWTQWMFTQFFENDIAYRGEALVNWDPIDNTVIANEQVLPDGTSERSGAVVEKKMMSQWMLRITNYADRLIDDLDDLDWPEHIKEAQRQWIGRSIGSLISFALSTGDSASVFTTRPDTLYGATFLVFAPEHELVEKNKGKITNWSEVETYIHAASQKTEEDRSNQTKEKTGVLLEGIHAVNPANGEEIPIFIADYVLVTYGTGTVMAVPAHDERDFAFAKKYDCQIRYVIEPTGPNFAFPDNDEKDADIENPYVAGYVPEEWNPHFSDPGFLCNSGEFDDMPSGEAKAAITKKVGGTETATYRLRDWSVGRQRYWGVPIPIVYDPEGTPHPIPAEHLPWTLPSDVDFRPTGEPPLAKSKELLERTERIFGAGWRPEVETMDTFLDSSWYFLRYIDNKNDAALVSSEAEAAWSPVDIYFGGAEHTTLHLLYSRFWIKALADLGIISHIEPYKKRINRGLILGPDGAKMSKSKGNVIDPDEQVTLVGADAVKMYLAFMGPYEGSNYPWDMGGIAGQRRFLERINGLSEHVLANDVIENETVTKQLHKTIAKLTNDIAQYKFNTAISSLMVFVNMAEKEGLSETSYLTFLRLMAPFAPHLTEELWEEAQQVSSIHTADFPIADPVLAADNEVTIGVQINGKLRGQITIAPDATETEAMNLVRSNPELATKLTEEPKKVIYKAGKILNIMS